MTKELKSFNHYLIKHKPTKLQLQMAELLEKGIPIEYLPPLSGKSWVQKHYKDYLEKCKNILILEEPND